MLVVGTRGRNLKGVHSLLPGSVSKYCLQQSPIPVIVVRPSPKREKKKKKRRADPNRRSYNHILEMSEQRGGRIFDKSSSTESSVSRLPDEEMAVAKALGLPASYYQNSSRSSLSVSDRSSLSHDDSDSPVPHSIDSILMRSPLDGSPASSEESVALGGIASSPGPHSGSSVLQDPPDESRSNAKEPDTKDTAMETSVEPTNRVPLPVIEVSTDNGDKAKQ